MTRKSEAVVVRSRGGKLAEVHLFPPSKKQGSDPFATDGRIFGAMENKVLPPRFDSLLEWLEENGRLGDVERMIEFLFQ